VPSAAIITDEQILRRPCHPVSSRQGRQIARDLLRYLEAHNRRASRDRMLYSGIGLAANQIGIDAAVCIVLLGANRVPLSLVNPRMVTRSGEMFTHVEGCLSFPGLHVEVERHVWVDVIAEGWPGVRRFGPEIKTDTEGNNRQLFQSAQIQHELDHLCGVVFTDHAVPTVSNELQETSTSNERTDRHRSTVN
jgi:peptide deformylase